MVARRLTRLGWRFVIGGVLALAIPQISAISVTVLIGMLLIGAAINFIILALEAQSRGKGQKPLLLGLTGAVTGACLLIWPAMTAVTLTALLATYSAVSGLLTIAFALDLRPASGWPWLLFGGSVGLLLAAPMWFQAPLAGASAVGSLVGVNLLTLGWSLIAMQGYAASAQPSSSDDTDMAI